jgi:Holliday junction resolvasome RuvABC endonuclease subunit
LKHQCILGIDVPGSKLGGYAVYSIEDDSLLESGTIEIGKGSERQDFMVLNRLLNSLYRQYRFSIVALEHPFLYIIAGWIGAIKLWTVQHRGVVWYQVTSSGARKSVLGAAKLRGKDAKAEVLRVIRARFEFFEFEVTQHEADAALYALAAAKFFENTFIQVDRRRRKPDASLPVL